MTSYLESSGTLVLSVASAPSPSVPLAVWCFVSHYWVRPRPSFLQAETRSNFHAVCRAQQLVSESVRTTGLPLLPLSNGWNVTKLLQKGRQRREFKGVPSDE